MGTQTTMEKLPEDGAKTLEQVIAYCQFQHLDAERVGSWVWVSFDEKPPQETREQLKEYGFKYSPRRKKWAHNCGHPTKSAHNSNPWETYDHATVSRKAAK